jgi:PhnB protein
MTIDLNPKHSRPTGHHTLTPGFSVRGAARVLAFIQQGLGGELVDSYAMPDGTLAHAEARIGDSVVMFGETRDGAQPMPAMLSLYVDTGAAVDALYARAIAAGGVSVTAPANQFYGYRSACVRDTGGNQWTICAVVEQLTRDDIERRMASIKH